MTKRTATSPDPLRRGGWFGLRPAIVLWALLAVQAICTAFFVFDSLTDVFGAAQHVAAIVQVLEYGVTVALVGGLIMTALTLRDHLARAQRLQQQIDVASGAFEQVLEAHFKAWGLTPSECDVARLAIKGLSVADMAELRGTAQGTIKAQSAAVYRKAGVTGRLQLISLFVEELMAEPVLESNSE